MTERIAELQRRPTTVLVVDDEEAALAVIPETLLDGLEDLGWHHLTVETAASGEEALRIGARAEIHLLVADVVMPGIDGIETYARLKERYPDLACVVMTAQGPAHTTPIRALRLGAADYVSKPVNPEYLVETCHRQLHLHHLRRAVNESRTLLDAVIGSVDAGVVAMAGEQILLHNAAATRMLRGEPTWARLEASGVLAARPTDEPRELPEVLLDGDDGRTRSVAVSGNLVVAPDGRRLGEVLVMRDITHVVEQKAMESFKSMAAIAAHEMKNSVTGLGLVTEHLVARLQDGRLEPRETQRMAEIVLESVARLDRFARSFLNFSRIPDPKAHPVYPNALVDDALTLYDQQKGLPEHVKVVRKLTEDLPLVAADPDLMFQVLQNLILNAVEAMGQNPSGTVTLETALEGRFVRLSVVDDGPGVAAHMLEKIFEPNVTTREAGSGLGLVIVRDIVHKHGGRVRLQSSYGDGARFDILLPIA